MSDKKKRAYNFKEIIPRKALYFYTCQSCGKKRNTRIYERAIGKICQKCLKNKISDNQPDLFGVFPSVINSAVDDFEKKSAGELV